MKRKLLFFYLPLKISNICMHNKVQRLKSRHLDNIGVNKK